MAYPGVWGQWGIVCQDIVYVYVACVLCTVWVGYSKLYYTCSQQCANLQQTCAEFIGYCWIWSSQQTDFLVMIIVVMRLMKKNQDLYEPGSPRLIADKFCDSVNLVKEIFLSKTKDFLWKMFIEKVCQRPCFSGTLMETSK